ncbi:hypothetical protein SCP_0114250 [Sparassis crispa]|uniref:DUF6533 domain-containing protein n=1 Tax=Sparassis crispa TaxID=139825 RepID=A0A401G8N3_9APHY|nr:hypothetical protein SCP_0114250 [Sparassis crispa]GBE78536.1 hypothetical protein SCP_0114250 [Sparassis crispa]
MALSSYQQDFLNSACYAAVFALIWYGYLLTSALEVKYIWRAKRIFTPACLLFYSVRYSRLTFALLILRSTWSGKSLLR